MVTSVSFTVPDGPDPLIGTTIAQRYTITRRLAGGGMGVVYEALQQPLSRAVALKLIRREVAADPVMHKRFAREAKAVSMLAHPCIVTVFDYGVTTDGAWFLAMELVSGETLREHLRRKRHLTLTQTLPIIEAVLSALAAAHAAGLVHRDLKPENIMIPHTGQAPGAAAAKVLDFGLAKSHDANVQAQAGVDNITQAGGFVGTPGYAAPEQAQGEPEHPRQDLYALGVLWWELLAGEHPFAAATPMKMLVRQLNSDAPPLALALAGGSDVPTALSPLLASLLKRDPHERPASALAVLAAVRALPHSGSQRAAHDAPTVIGLRAPVAAPVVTPTLRTPHTAVPSSAPQSARKPALLAAALVAAVVGAGVAARLIEHAPQAVDDAGDPPNVVETVDAPPPSIAVDTGPHRIELVVLGVPRFLAVRALAQMFDGARVELFAANRSVLVLVASDSTTLADRLQGHALQTDTAMVLEVTEVTASRVTLQAVTPEASSGVVDAGPQALDAGPVDAVVGPDGLSP